MLALFLHFLAWPGCGYVFACARFAASGLVQKRGERPPARGLQSMPRRRLVTPRPVFACAIFACPGLAWVRVCSPLPSSTAKLRELEAESPYLARVSAFSVRPGTPRGLRTSTSSTCLVTNGSAKLPNFDLLNSFEDLKLREASESRFRRHCRESGAPGKLRGGSEVRFRRQFGGIRAPNLDFVNSF